MSRKDPHALRKLADVVMERPVDLGDDPRTSWIDLAIEHGVHGLMNEALTRGRIDGLSRADRERLHDIALADAAADLTQVAAVRELLEALEKEGVAPLLVKGLPVAELHYEKRHFRHRTDIDLYLPPGEDRAVEQLLEALGYRLFGTSGKDPTVRQFHASRGEGTPIPIHFDLHRGISNRALFRSILPFESVDREAQAVPGLHPAARTLSNPHLLIHACVHRIAHGRNTQSRRLLWLNDIRLILAALDAASRSRFVDDAVAWAVGAICADGLQTTADTFGLQPDQDLLRRLRARSAQEPSAAFCAAGRWRWMLSDLAAEPSLAARWRYLRQVMTNRFMSA